MCYSGLGHTLVSRILIPNKILTILQSYHCPRYHGRLTDYIGENSCILFDPPVKNIFQLTTNTLGEGYN